MQACQTGDNEIYFRLNKTVSHFLSPTFLSSHPTWIRNHRVPFVNARLWCCDLLVVSTAVQAGESFYPPQDRRLSYWSRHDLEPCHFQEKRDCVTYRRRRRFPFKQEVKSTWQPRPLIRPRPKPKTAFHRLIRNVVFRACPMMSF
jgi:hypothetical protein